jgi:hypothetical protein
MNKIATSLVGVGLSALVLSGCAAAPAVGAEVIDSRIDSPEITRVQTGPLGDAAGLIEEQFPNDFAYALFDDDNAIHVAFKAEAPAHAVAILEATGQPHVVVESVGFNAADYSAAQDSVVRQTQKYATTEREVSVASDPSIGAGVITVSFQSNDASLLGDPGIVESLEVDAPFKIVFDDTNTSPVAWGLFG